MAEIGSTVFRCDHISAWRCPSDSEDISYRVVRRAQRGVPHGVWYPEDRACEVRGIRTGGMVDGPPKESQDTLHLSTGVGLDWWDGWDTSIPYTTNLIYDSGRRRCTGSYL